MKTEKTRMNHEEKDTHANMREIERFEIVTNLETDEDDDGEDTNADHMFLSCPPVYEIERESSVRTPPRVSSSSPSSGI